MALSCGNINTEAARLKTAFASCRNLKASDLDAMVDLILAIQTCSTGMNQDNKFKIIALSYDDVTSGVNHAFNALPAFTTGETEIMIIQATLTSGAEKIFILHDIGKGSYGVGNTQLPLASFKELISSSAGVSVTLDSGTVTQQSASLPSTNRIKLNLATQSTAGVMSATDKAKLDNIGVNGEENVQSDWANTDIANDAHILNKPTNLSDFTDDINAANVQSDWDQTDIAAKDYIKNKPSLTGVTNLTNTPNAINVDVESSTGTDTTILGATQTLAGVMSAADKAKLDGLTGSEQNVQSDWNQTDTLSDDYIKNKPIFNSATNLNSSATGINVSITSDTGSDATINAVNTTLAGVMLPEDKVKLDQIESNAEANIQSDWNETNASIAGHIINRPSVIDDLTSSSSTDLLSAAQGKILNEKIDALGTSEGIYDTIASRDLSTTHVNGDIVLVVDASGDLTVNSGWALYRFNTGVWLKISEEESLDSSNTSNLSLGVATTTTRDIDNDGGTGVTITEATSTEAGLLSTNNRAIILEQAKKHNFVSLLDPLASNDSSEGYQVGSMWVNLISNKAYICVSDSVNSAEWKEIGNTNQSNLIEKTESFTLSNVDTSVTVSETPSLTARLIVFRNGLEQSIGVSEDFNISGSVISFTEAFEDGETVKVYYSHI